MRRGGTPRERHAHKTHPYPPGCHSRRVSGGAGDQPGRRDRPGRSAAARRAGRGASGGRGHARAGPRRGGRGIGEGAGAKGEGCLEGVKIRGRIPFRGGRKGEETRPASPIPQEGGRPPHSATFRGAGESLSAFSDASILRAAPFVNLFFDEAFYWPIDHLTRRSFLDQKHQTHHLILLPRHALPGGRLLAGGRGGAQYRPGAGRSACCWPPRTSASPWRSPSPAR